MTDTPLQSIQKFQTDTDIFDAFLNNDPNTEVDFSAAQDGSDMQPSLQMLLANLGTHPASGGPVAAVQTAALPANVYNNGAAGVGATLTATANAAFPAADIDTVAPVVGMRVLINAPQANAGIYVFTAIGDGTHPWILTRAIDANTPAALGYLFVYVTGGATLAGTAQLIPVSAAGLVIGTTNLPAVTVSGSAAVAAEITRATAAESAIKAGQSSVALTHTANFAPDATAYLWPIDATAGNVVATIPAGAGFAGQKWKFVRLDASGHTVTLAMSGADTLNGAATQLLAGQWAKLEVQNQRGTTAWYGS